MIGTQTRQEIIDDYHSLWYSEAAKGLTWGGTTYHGYKVWKNPTDLHLYGELIWQLRPQLIIETGTAFGGSALFYAHHLDEIGSGRVLSIDLKEVDRNYPHHPRISYLGGWSSVDLNVLEVVNQAARRVHDPVMVILDSDHSEAHVLAELDQYAPMVTENSYLIVEDVDVNGHPVYPEHGPGPFEALERWLPAHPEFVRDERLPAQMLWSSHSWLRRRRT